MDCARGRDRPRLARWSDCQDEFAVGGICRARDPGAIVFFDYGEHRGLYLAKLDGAGRQYQRRAGRGFNAGVVRGRTWRDSGPTGGGRYVATFGGLGSAVTYSFAA